MDNPKHDEVKIELIEKTSCQEFVLKSSNSWEEAVQVELTYY